MSEEQAKVNIIKPEIDDREYEYFVLENGIRTVVVSHPESEISAASLRMATGMFEDPIDVQGLAHFVEHMLFMGTEKFPVEKEFQEFVKKNGGTYNGYTSNTNTTYFFEVEKSHYQDCLDRFSSFYVCPLLSKDGVKRELNAVHSEYELYFTNDGWKEYQIMRSLGAPTKHPFCKFGIGNRETLDQENIHDRVLEFYKENYSANLMTLCLYGTESVEDLKKYAIKYFSKIRNEDKKFRHYPGSIFHPPSMRHKIHHVVPIKESRTLKFFFPMKYELKDYRTSMLSLISHLVGHESEGSLFYHLKKKGWLNSLYCGPWFKWNGLTIFGCVCMMSVEGEKHVEEIIKFFFEYVKFAKSLNPDVLLRIFNECKKVRNELGFRFKENIRPAQICPSLTEAMFCAKPEELLMYNSHCYFEFSEEVFQEEIDQISVDNMMCIWSSSTHDPKAEKKEEEEDGEKEETLKDGWKKEKWFNTKYKTEELPTKLIEEIKSCKIQDYFFAPKINEFLPDKLDVLKLTEDGKLKNKYPRKISTSGKESKVQVFYKQDTQFKRPMSSHCIRFCLERSHESVKSQFCQSILGVMMKDAMNEITYYAQCAKLSFSVSGDDCGFVVSVSGWNDSLDKLTEVVMDYFTNLGPRLDEKRFDVLKEDLLKDYKNMEKDMIVRNAIRMSSVAFHADSTRYYEEFIPVIEKLKFSELKEYYKKLFDQKISVRVLCMGNDKEEDISKMVSERIEKDKMLSKMSGLKMEEEYFERIVKLPGQGGPWVIARKTTNELDKNSTLVNTIEIGKKEELTDIITYFFTLSMSSDVFDVLRTKEQLGYIVGMRFLNIHNIKFCQFYVQSSDVHPVKISERVRKFIDEYYEVLEKKLTQEYFDAQIKVMIQKYIEKPKNLREELGRYWGEIEKHTLKFERMEHYAKLLKDGKLKISHILDFYKKHFLGERKEVQVQIFAEKYAKDMKKLNMEAGIKEERFTDDIYFLSKNAKEFHERYYKY